MTTLKETKIGFQNKLSLNTGHKYCRMLQGGHSAIFLTFISYHFSLRSLFSLFLVATSDRFYCTVLAIKQTLPFEFCCILDAFTDIVLSIAEI